MQPGIILGQTEKRTAFSHPFASGVFRRGEAGVLRVRNESLQAYEVLGLQPDVLPRGMAEGGILFSA